MLKRPLAWSAFVFLLLVVSIGASGDTNGTVVDIPGTVESAGNVVFNYDGAHGFVAYKGESNNGVCSFDAASGNIIDNRFVPFSPKAIAIDKLSSTIVVSGSENAPSPYAQFYIATSDDQGRFGNFARIAVEAPISEGDEWVPDKVVLSNSGYFVFSNKRSLFVYSIVTDGVRSFGAKTDVKDVISLQDYGPKNRLINIDLDSDSGTLAAVLQTGDDAFSILLYKLDPATGKLSPADIGSADPLGNRFALPLGEVFSPSSNIAFNETGSELYYVSSSSGTLYAFSVNDAELSVRGVCDLLGEDDALTAFKSERKISYRRPQLSQGGQQSLLFINRPGFINRSINRPGFLRPNAVMAVNPQNMSVISIRAFEETEKMLTTLSADGSTAYIAMRNGNFYIFETLSGQTKAAEPLSGGMLDLTFEESTGRVAATNIQAEVGTVNLIKVK